VHRSFLTYVAVVISVVNGAGDKIAIDEAWIVADAGIIVNLERVRSQLEGAVLFGLSNALYGSITAKNGAVEQTNFRDYPMLRIKDAPRRVNVEVHRQTHPRAAVRTVDGVPSGMTAMNTMRGVVLAAGEGRRTGGSKALLARRRDPRPSRWPRRCAGISDRAVISCS